MRTIRYIGQPVPASAGQTQSDFQDGSQVTHTPERVVRDELIRRTARAHEGVPMRFVPELDLCQAQARIDLAAINGRLCGWEIKTAVDRLARLPRQQPVYSRVFDRVWLVADGRHVPPALEIPDWWGVLRIDGDVKACRLVEVRRSRLNPSVDLSSLVRLLWRPEVLEELQTLGLSAGLERSPRAKLWQRLADAAPLRVSRAGLQRRVRTRLMHRTGWRADAPRTPSGGW